MLEKNFTEGMPKEGTEQRAHYDKGTHYDESYICLDMQNISA